MLQQNDELITDKHKYDDHIANLEEQQRNTLQQKKALRKRNRRFEEIVYRFEKDV